MPEIKYKKIAIIYGGPSNEAEVSERTAKAVFEAIKKLGLNAELIEFSLDIGMILAKHNFDCVYNAMHGKFGEDGALPGLLEVIGIPYTHSGVLSSALAMDKFLTKNILNIHKVRSPVGKKIKGGELLNNLESLAPKIPFALKPVDEGSSVNLFIIRNKTEFGLFKQNAVIDENINYLCENYIEGKEISVAVLNGKALGTVEIIPKNGVYDYESKYTAGATEFTVPAKINLAAEKTATDYAEIAHRKLGCNGVSRSDFIISNSNEVYFLEINTHPGMTESSLVPKIAQHLGINFENLVERILATARLENS